jgi:hypothetical protein
LKSHHVTSVFLWIWTDEMVWQIWSNLRLELHKVCFDLNSFPYTGALVACIKVEHPVGLGWTSNGFRLNIQWIIIITA